VTAFQVYLKRDAAFNLILKKAYSESLRKNAFTFEIKPRDF